MWSSWRHAAIVVPVALAGYLAVLDFVDLFPLNDLSVVTTRERVLGVVVNELPLLLVAAAVASTRWALRAGAVVVSALFFIGHVAAWWIPYVLGASAAEVQEHAVRYGRTLTFLPGIADHPTPNTAHVIVGILALATLLCTAMAVRTPEPQRRVPSPV